MITYFILQLESWICTYSSFLLILFDLLHYIHWSFCALLFRRRLLFFIFGATASIAPSSSTNIIFSVRLVTCGSCWTVGASRPFWCLLFSSLNQPFLYGLTLPVDFIIHMHVEMHPTSLELNVHQKAKRNWLAVFKIRLRLARYILRWTNKHTPFFN